MTRLHFLHLTIWFLLLARGDRLTIDTGDDEAWQAWKIKYEKVYTSSADEARARFRWSRKVEQVQAHNRAYLQGLESYSKAVYKWADQDEAVIWRGLDRPASFFNATATNQTNRYDDDDLRGQNKLPKNIDYRVQGYVSPVDDQGNCHCCWAISAVGAIEGLMKKTNGEMEKLSFQQVLDCTSDLDDCWGGSDARALIYARDNGLQSDCDYAYEAEKKECRYYPYGVRFMFNDFKYKTDVSERRLKAYVASIGPISATIVTPQSFMDYKGGIFSTEECQTQTEISRFLLIVGYGSEGRRKFWILKNSFGQEWGENGYMKLERKKQMCKIGSFISWPTAV